MFDSTFSPKGLMNALATELKAEFQSQPLQLEMRVSPTLPEAFAGDSNHLAIVLRTVLQHAIRRVTSGQVTCTIIQQQHELVWEIVSGDDGRLVQNTNNQNRDTLMNDRALARIIDRLEGCLSQKNISEHVTQWTLVLPSIPVPVAPLCVEEDPSQETPQVLVVSDVPQNARFLRYILEKQNVRVTTTGDMAAACKHIAEKTDLKGWDLVLVDLPMHGDQAVSTVSQLRDAGQLRPIVAVVSDVPNEDDLGTLEVDAYVEKPFSRPALMNVVAEVLGFDSKPASPCHSPRTWAI